MNSAKAPVFKQIYSKYECLYAMNKVMSYALQNTTGVEAIQGFVPEFFKQQIDAAYKGIYSLAVKNGIFIKAI